MHAQNADCLTGCVLHRRGEIQEAQSFVPLAATRFREETAFVHISGIRGLEPLGEPRSIAHIPADQESLGRRAYDAPPIRVADPHEIAMAGESAIKDRHPLLLGPLDQFRRVQSRGHFEIAPAVIQPPVEGGCHKRRVADKRNANLPRHPDPYGLADNSSQSEGRCQAYGEDGQSQRLPHRQSEFRARSP